MPSWIPWLLLALVVGGVIFTVLLTRKSGRQRARFEERLIIADRKIDEIREEVRTATYEEAEKERAELERIARIKDEEARLRALADFGNRRRKP